MTREEKIKHEAEIYVWTANQFDIELAFKEGAKWADEHPKQDLINIEKVCKWLDGNFMNLIWGKTRSVYAGGNFATVDEMIANFRKAMEE